MSGDRFKKDAEGSDRFVYSGVDAQAGFEKRINSANLTGLAWLTDRGEYASRLRVTG